MRGALVLCAVVCTVACGGNKFTEPDVPQVSGTYGGNAIFSVEITQVGGGQFHSLAFCPGTLTIRQSGSQLAGNFLLGPCSSSAVISGDVRGTIRPDGGVSFSLTPGQLRIPVVAGCPINSPGQYNGVIAGSNMQAVLTTTVVCADASGSVVITERVNGNR